MKFHVSRRWLELANQWLEVTRQFLWIDSDSTPPSHDSDFTRKIFRWLWLNSDSKGLWLWLDSHSTKMTQTHHWFWTSWLSIVIMQHHTNILCKSLRVYEWLGQKWLGIHFLFLLLQPLRWRCVECVIHHEWDVREEQQYVYVAQTSNNRVIGSHEPCCCLLPQYEALRTCR